MFVLSPIHFYEIGTVQTEKYEKTIHFVEELQPVWILSRADLQLYEFRDEWNRFWRQEDANFQPYGDLAYMTSAFFRKSSRCFDEVTPRSFIEPFRNPNSNQDLRKVISMNGSANEKNRLKYKSGSMSPAFYKEIQRQYVARQIARLDEEDGTYEAVNRIARELLADLDFFRKISIFIENGSMQRLKAYVVESVLTAKRWAGKAKLNENRFIDREHAVSALSYCNFFITTDAELSQHCQAVSDTCGFAIAKVLDGKSWIEHLQKKL